MLTGYFSSTHAQGTLNEYCILKGRVKNDLYKFIEVFVYESLFSKKDTISIDQAGYFEKRIAFSGKRDILLRYGDDNCRIYLESNSINLEWDGLNFASTISVINKTDFINDFLVKYYKEFRLERDGAIKKLDTCSSLKNVVDIVSELNENEFKFLHEKGSLLDSSSFQKCAYDIFYGNLHLITGSDFFENYNFSDPVKMSNFPFISLFDRQFSSLEKKAFSRFKESNPSTDTITLRKFAKAQTINIFRSTYSIIDSIALHLSEEYRYFLHTYFIRFLQNIYSQRLGKNIPSDLSNYSSFLKSIISNGQIIDWLIGIKIKSKITTGTTSEMQFYKDLDLVLNKHLKEELEYYYKLFSSLQPGAIAPAVIVKDEKGKNKSLSAYAGKYVFIDFWSSDCLPCISDITNYSKPVADKYKGKNVVFVYISLDNIENEWYKSIKKYSPAGINLRAVGGWNDKIVKEYAIFAIPRYVVINPNGTIKDAQAEGLSSLLFSENPFQ